MPFDWQAEFAAPASQTPAVIPTSASIPSPQPTIIGDQLGICISQKMYEKGIEYCKCNLRGRMILNKGDKSCSSTEIQQKLQK